MGNTFKFPSDAPKKFIWQGQQKAIQETLLRRAGKMPVWVISRLALEENKRDIRGQLQISETVRTAAILRYPNGLEVLRDTEAHLQQGDVAEAALTIPALVKEIYQAGRWRKYAGAFFTIEFKSFKSFAETAVSAGGLGTDLATLIQLCEGDQAALDILKKCTEESESA